MRVLRCAVILLMSVLPILLFAKEISFSPEEIDLIIRQFEEDKQTILFYQKREAKLRKEEPQVEYEFPGDGHVKQKVTIPVLRDNPLEYEIEFDVVNPYKEGWFPFKFFLGGFFVGGDLEELDFRDWVDFKVGVKVVSLSPLNIRVIRNLGLNLGVGIKSIGISTSYSLSKPFSNTSIHLFGGLSYEGQKSLGVGVALYL